MSTPEAGWYDDPWSPEQYRYWDGQAWTHHAAPKHVPSPATAPPRPPGPYAGPRVSGSPYSGGQYSGGQYSGGQYRGGQYSGSQYPGGQYSGGQLSGSPYPPVHGPQADSWRPTFGPTTPEGVPLSGWWRRVGAALLDQLIIAVIALPFAGYFWFQAADEFTQYVGDTMDADAAGRSTSSVPLPDGLETNVAAALVITLIIGLVYQLVLLRRYNATWGKMALGIRVRLREHDGQLSWATILKRVGFVEALGLLSVIPLIGIPFSLARLLDVLWPLWDPYNQALHDKVAATNVVLTR